MKATSTAIPDMLIIEPKVLGDARGFFFESFNQRAFNEAIGLNFDFVQDSHSAKDVLHGLHYQVQHPQGKLVRVVVRGGVRCGGGYPQGFAHVWKGEGPELAEDDHKRLWPLVNNGLTNLSCL